MRRRKLKPYVLPTLMIVGIICVMFATAMLRVNLNKNKPSDELTSYVTNTVLEEEEPVIKESTIMINPYKDTDIKIGKNYYDYNNYNNPYFFLFHIFLTPKHKLLFSIIIIPFNNTGINSKFFI